MNEFMLLNSVQDMPLYVRKAAVLVVEGFTFANDNEKYPNHVGARLTLQAGQCTETIYCTHTAEAVIDAIKGRWS